MKKRADEQADSERVWLAIRHGRIDLLPGRQTGSIQDGGGIAFSLPATHVREASSGGPRQGRLPSRLHLDMHSRMHILLPVR